MAWKKNVLIGSKPDIDYTITQQKFDVYFEILFYCIEKKTSRSVIYLVEFIGIIFVVGTIGIWYVYRSTGVLKKKEMNYLYN
jgi:hypothetical protein